MSTNAEGLTTQAIRCSQQLWGNEEKGRIGSENKNDLFQWRTVIMGYRWTGIMVSGCLNRGSTVVKLDWDHLANYPRMPVWARKVTAWTPTKNFPEPHHNTPRRMMTFLFIYHYTHYTQTDKAVFKLVAVQVKTKSAEMYLSTTAKDILQSAKITIS